MVEDVFGADFFATAPVPEEDVFSKEYIEEFQLQKKASQKENLEAVAYEVPAQVPEKDELQAQEEAEEAESEDSADDKTNHRKHRIALETKLVIQHQGCGHPGCAQQDHPQILFGVRKDRFCGAQQIRQRLQVEL